MKLNQLRFALILQVATFLIILVTSWAILATFFRNNQGKFIFIAKFLFDNLILFFASMIFPAGILSAVFVGVILLLSAIFNSIGEGQIQLVALCLVLVFSVICYFVGERVTLALLKKNAFVLKDWKLPSQTLLIKYGFKPGHDNHEESTVAGVFYYRCCFGVAMGLVFCMFYTGSNI